MHARKVANLRPLLYVLQLRLGLLMKHSSGGTLQNAPQSSSTFLQIAFLAMRLSTVPHAIGRTPLPTYQA